MCRHHIALISQMDLSWCPFHFDLVDIPIAVPLEDEKHRTKHTQVITIKIPFVYRLMRYLQESFGCWLLKCWLRRRYYIGFSFVNPLDHATYPED